MKTDIIVIGSGFAGAVAAARFAGQGLQVLLLERGPWRETPAVKAAGITAEKLPAQNKPSLVLRHIRPPAGPKQITLNKKGMLELHIGHGVKTVSSSSVGGGSHIWSALIGRPLDPNFWNGCAEGLSENELKPHYDKVWPELNPSLAQNADDMPNHTSFAWRDKKWFVDTPENDQFPTAINLPEPFNRQESGLKHAISLTGEDGMFGASSGGKANADALYLLPYLNKGITVKDMHEVRNISHDDNGYQVNVRDIQNKRDYSVAAPKVVLAAGTMNTVKILCDSQDNKTLNLMPGLGKGFGTNGDCMATWKPSGGQYNSSLGTPVHGKLVVDGQADEVTILSAGIETPPMPAWLPNMLKNKVQDTGGNFQLVAMAPDDANGVVKFENGRLKLDYRIKENPVFEKVFSALDKITTQTGSKVKFDSKIAMTAHPLGGARIASSDREGVVDGKGEVYNNPGLFITDGSVLPRATGAPPTLSIAAWSSYVASKIIEKIAHQLIKKPEKKMITAIVTYKPDPSKTMEDVNNAFKNSIPLFSSVPGLKKKIYCFDEEAFQGTSVYLWESKEAAEACYGSTTFQEAFKRSFGAVPEITFIPALQIVENDL